MLRLFLIAAVIFLASCGKAKLRKYESIVMAADKFEIVYPDHKDTVLEENIAYFKDVLIQHIVPGRKHDTITDVRVDIFKSNKRTGFITMNFKVALSTLIQRV